MATAVRNTEPDDPASNNTPFPAPQCSSREVLDAQAATSVDRGHCLASVHRAVVFCGLRSPLMVFVGVLFALMSSGPALAQDGVPTDSDGDGLADSEELSTYGTDPGAEDTDGDGFNDAVEVQLGLDPLNPDSDGDGFDDPSEYLAGSDPLLSADTPYGMVAIQVPSLQDPAAGLTPVTVSPQPLTDPGSLAFDDSQSGRSPLFPLFISLASAAAVGMAFLLALVPQVGSTIESGDTESL